MQAVVKMKSELMQSGFFITAITQSRFASHDISCFLVSQNRNCVWSSISTDNFRMIHKTNFFLIFFWKLSILFVLDFSFYFEF